VEVFEEELNGFKGSEWDGSDKNDSFACSFSLEDVQ
jgi:hypothetical protein